MCGDVADDLLSGFCCEECGSIVDGEAPGYPRLCTDCEEEDDEELS